MEESKRKENLEKGLDFYEEAVRYARIGAFTNALQYFDQAEHLFILINDLHCLARLWHEKLRCFISMKRHDDANSMYDKAVRAYYKNKNQKGLVSVFLLSADMREDQGDYYQAMEKTMQALALMEKENLKDSKGTVYRNLVRYYSNLRLRHESNLFIDKALEFCEEDSEEYAWCYDIMGRNFYAIYEYEKAEFALITSYEAYLRLGKYDEASKIMNDLVKHYEKMGLTNKVYDLRHKMVGINRIAISNSRSL